MNQPRIYLHRAGPAYALYMDAANEALLRSIGEVVIEGGREEPFSPEELVERMRGCSAVLSLTGHGAWELTPEVFRRVGTVKLICISHWMGQLVDTARECGIEFTEGSNANTVAVAEWTLAAALMGVRRLPHFDRSLKSQSPWCEPRRNAGLLCESTVGLVGMGRVGWYVAQQFRALGARVIVFDKDRKRIDELGLPAVTLDELLRTADVVSLHLPVTPQTTGMLGAREFALLKDGCVFINSARAALYDEPALVAELRKNRFTAYLDVFATEPLPLDHPLRAMDNAFITPHIAGDNAAMALRCGREAILTLKDYFEGKGVRNLQYAAPQRR
jgi:phosphoglycerate dehydrogenase-like enzyme